MPFEEILLLFTAAILTVAALITGYFLGAEVLRILRDVTARRPRSDESDAAYASGVIRRIIPFRDRHVVQRIINYLEGQDKSR